MIINPNQQDITLQDIIYVIEKLKLKYKIFYITSKDEADKGLPPPDTVYIYVVKK